MAMIVEVLSADDRVVRARVRADALPVTVGRGWDNDIILEDAYVDARHARIHREADGTVLIEDLGSLNGLVVAAVAGDGERQPRVAIGGGTEVRLGRTLLRFHDLAEPVPPALPYLPEPHEDPAIAAPALLTPRAWRYGMPLAASAVIALQMWLSSYERGAGTVVLGGVIVFLLVTTTWTGVWSLAGRITVGRFCFGDHFAVISAAAIAVLAMLSIDEWATFVFPAGRFWDVLSVGLGMGVVAAVIAGHLAFASRMTASRRWRAGGIASASILAFGLAATIMKDNTFSDVPEFPGVLKPMVVRWPAPVDIDGFLDAADGARRQVDDLVRTEQVP